MSQESRDINEYFKTALKNEADDLLEKLNLTELQEKIFKMRYIQRKDITFIADELGWSYPKINKELVAIRRKLARTL